MDGDLEMTSNDRVCVIGSNLTKQDYFFLVRVLDTTHTMSYEKLWVIVWVILWVMAQGISIS